MKVLIMPSWYPNKDQQTGSFFKEQAQFLNTQGFEVKVLMGQFLHTKSSLYHRVKRWLKGKSNRITTTYLDQNPEAYSFPLIIQKSWSEQQQFDIANRAYLNAYKQLVKTGWMPDVINVQGAFKAGFSAQVISNLYKVPYVVIEHSPFNLFAYSKFKQDKIKKVLIQANKVAGVSHYQKKRLQEYGINRDIEVVWNFMDENRFRIKQNIDSKKFVISTIITPAKVKDVVTFFKAIAFFATQIEDKGSVEVVVIGNYPGSKDISYYEAQANTLNILDLCTFIPVMEREEVEHLLQRSNVFISTSIDEPYGVAIREAMLCGTPVISTRSGGPEDSINEDTGILVDIGDYKAIATHLKFIKDASITFDSDYIRNYIIAQSGRQAFLKRMNDFYCIQND